MAEQAAAARLLEKRVAGWMGEVAVAVEVMRVEVWFAAAAGVVEAQEAEVNLARALRADRGWDRREILAAARVLKLGEARTGRQ